ncbi:MAG: class II aldolase/adducin family protein [Rhodospirillales bacterium]|nr:class II aldolase/adducin family protein [Rhodospirillales bacterium]
MTATVAMPKAARNPFATKPVDEILASDEEAALRIQLAAAYRMFEHYGWTKLTVIFGHITMRVPGPDRHFLINPYGLRYDEITASNLVKIGIDGHKVEDSPYDVNPAGFAIHGAIHAVAPGAHCVMHTHTRAGMAVAALDCGLLPISMASMSFNGGIGYHEYEGSVVTDDEKPRLVRDLGNHKALMLKNHGLLTVGETIPEAFIYLWRLESSCQVQLDAMATGEKLTLPKLEVTEKSARQMDMLPEGSNDIGVLSFAANMRLMDKIDPSYRH